MRADMTIESERFVSPWPNDWGTDEYGHWATFIIPNQQGNKVTQRMRWVSSGIFLMGSPEDEPGRYADEGPQHLVTLTQGFWMFDTACTQVLWEAVMGKNPSRFQSPTRPVEQVSWDDVQHFLTQINARVPGLNLTLPTEAQWEYACRAGTETEIYTGDLAILGERNAPALDPIAWYGGNSGVDFELKNGYHSSDWEEKQYPHRRAGTHPVKLKQPNPWGLYDMLGNVWEWCQDGQRTYQRQDETDPVGPLQAGANRVIRGGSWYGYAQFVRAAYRYWYDPGLSYDYLGFRCVSANPKTF
jgi:formylglycine-generating enzyme required for sulfatase activity